MRAMVNGICGALLFSLLLGVASSSGGEDDPFRLMYLHFDGKRQEHTAADFNGDGLIDIAVASINFDAQPPVRRLSLFLQEKGRGFPDTPNQMWRISSAASALVFGRFLREKGRDICFLASDGVYYYPFDAASGKFLPEPRKLLHVGTFFSAPSPSSIPLLHPATDLDGNGLDDLLVPVPDGYAVYHQTALGRFGKISRPSLPGTNAAEEQEISAARFTLTRSLPRLDIEDVNGDGRKDLISIKGMAISYFFQTKEGTFPAAPTLKYNLGDLADPVQTDKVTVSLVDFTDINGDKKADLVLTKIGGVVGAFKSMKTSVMVYIGNGTGRFLRLDTKIALDGLTIVDPAFADVNGDGAKDMFLSSIRADLLDVGKTLLVKSVTIEYFLYVFDRAIDNYPVGGPEYASRVSVDLKDIEKLGIDSMPLISIGGDHSGDRRPDMVKLRADGLLEICQGMERRRISAKEADFSKGPFFSLRLPRLPRSLAFADLNGDVIADILLEYNSAVGVVLSTKR